MKINFNGASKIHVVVITIIMHYNEILRDYQESMRAEQESNNQLYVALYEIINSFTL